MYHFKILHFHILIQNLQLFQILWVAAFRATRLLLGLAFFFNIQDIMSDIPILRRTVKHRANHTRGIYRISSSTNNYNRIIYINIYFLNDKLTQNQNANAKD